MKGSKLDRRTFLQIAAVGTLGLTLPPTFFSQTKNAAFPKNVSSFPIVPDELELMERLQPLELYFLYSPLINPESSNSFTKRASIYSLTLA